jgi:hypothetical protein
MKMITIVDEDGEVLQGMVTQRGYRVIMSNIRKQKKDPTKKREEWLQRVISKFLKPALTIVVLFALLQTASCDSSYQQEQALAVGRTWMDDIKDDCLDSKMNLDGACHDNNKYCPYHEPLCSDVKLRENHEVYHLVVDALDKITDYVVDKTELAGEFMKAATPDLRDLIFKSIELFFSVISSVCGRVGDFMWFLTTFVPAFAQTTYHYSYRMVVDYEQEVKRLKEDFRKQQMLCVALCLVAMLIVACYLIVVIFFSLKKNAEKLGKFCTRAYYSIVDFYNGLSFRRKKTKVIVARDGVDVRRVNGTVEVSLNGVVVFKGTEPSVDNSVKRERAYAEREHTIAKVEYLNDKILRTQVTFYSNKGNTPDYIFRGQGTYYQVEMKDGVTKQYLVTASHVADATTHFSAANTHGNVNQRFVPLPKWKIRTEYNQKTDEDFAMCEISQAEISKAGLTGYPSLVPAKTNDKIITETDKLEAIGIGHPLRNEDGFYLSYGDSLDPPYKDQPLIGGHTVSTKGGWSGCGLFIRRNETVNFVGIHLGEMGANNGFLIFEEMEDDIKEDYWDERERVIREAKSGEYQGHNRKYPGRKGYEAQQRRRDRACYVAQTCEYDNWTQENAAKDGAKPIEKLVDAVDVKPIEKLVNAMVDKPIEKLVDAVDATLEENIVKPLVKAETCEITRDDESDIMCEHADEAFREKTSASKKLAKEKVQFEKTLVNIATIEKVAAALKTKVAPLAEKFEANDTPVVERKLETKEDFRSPVVRPLTGLNAAPCSGSAQNLTDISIPEQTTSSTQNQSATEIDTSSEVALKRSTEQKLPEATPKSDSSSSSSSQKSKKVTIGPVSTKSMSSDQSTSITTQSSTEESGFQQEKSNKHKKLLRQCTTLLASVGVADLAKINMDSISREDLTPFFRTLSKMCAKPPSQDTLTDSPTEQTARS